MLYLAQTKYINARTTARVASSSLETGDAVSSQRPHVVRIIFTAALLPSPVTPSRWDACTMPPLSLLIGFSTPVLMLSVCHRTWKLVTSRLGRKVHCAECGCVQHYSVVQDFVFFIVFCCHQLLSWWHWKRLTWGQCDFHGCLLYDAVCVFFSLRGLSGRVAAVAEVSRFFFVQHICVVTVICGKYQTWAVDLDRSKMGCFFLFSGVMWLIWM